MALDYITVTASCLKNPREMTGILSKYSFLVLAVLASGTNAHNPFQATANTRFPPVQPCDDRHIQEPADLGFTELRFRRQIPPIRTPVKLGRSSIHICSFHQQRWRFIFYGIGTSRI